jgi:CubicO group peptidase (beta-lactamase class C family)
VVLLPASGAAQIAPASRAAQIAPAAAVRRIADDLRRTAKLPGLSVAVMQRGRVVFAEGFGHADVGRRLPVTPGTQFRTASVAKVITATAVARLVESGQLDLDAPVRRYVPSFPDTGGDTGGRITPRQLAGHLSGLPHYSDGDRVEDRVYASVADALSVFAHLPPAAPPGARYRYSTHGYTLLSAAVEGAAGVPFLEYLARSVLQPLGMRATGPERPGAPARPPRRCTRWRAPAPRPSTARRTSATSGPAAGW